MTGVFHFEISSTALKAVSPLYRGVLVGRKEILKFISLQQILLSTGFRTSRFDCKPLFFILRWLVKLGAMI